MGEFHSSYRSCMLMTRMLGTQGLTVSALGLGCMGMSQSYGTPTTTESVATIHRALELGRDLLRHRRGLRPVHQRDAARPALEGRRDRAMIATKFGLRDRDQPTAAASTAARRTSARRSRARSGGSAPTTSTCCTSTASIRRCRSRTSSARWPSWCARARCASSACREAGAQTIRRAHAVHPISALQSEYSLWERNLEARDHAAAARARHRPGAVQPARPRLPDRDGAAGGGVSRGRLPPRRSRASRAPTSTPTCAPRPWWARSPPELGATPGQVALAWVLHQGEDVVPIPGTKRRRYLEENVAAADIRLSAAEMARLDAALPPEVVAGPRYNENMMGYIDR